ncbi:DUF3419 family protein [Shimazuella kribbensis]|uniref:DUF3419 family protein n=1 Tax=Shimazuella kribbensis TaxID=139808 RepID=UPI00040A5248|nr:DUF3419 family protein [Shimazuella kribbensis]
MNEIYFAQIREDSRIERDLCSVYQPKTIATIGSGGCTAFSLLHDDIDHLYVIDINPAQTALIELKKAAIQTLDREHYLQFIGEKTIETSEREQTYKNLKPMLSHRAKEYWDRQIEQVRKGINYSGATERFYHYIGTHLRKHLYSEEIWQQLFRCSDIEEQRLFYQQYCTSEAWNVAIRILLSKTTHLQFYPAQMFQQAGETIFSQFFSSKFKQEVCNKRIHHNYFLSQLLYGSYLWKEKEGMPYYLSDQGYAQAKKNAEKCMVIREDIAQFLAATDHQIDAFFLSNVFDWIQENERNHLFQAITKAKSPQAVFLTRSMWGIELPTDYSKMMHVNEDQCDMYLSMERSMMYQKLIVGTWS